MANALGGLILFIVSIFPAIRRVGGPAPRPPLRFLVSSQPGLVLFLLQDAGTYFSIPLNTIIINNKKYPFLINNIDNK